MYTASEINSEYKTKFYEEPDRRPFWAEVARAKFCVLANPKVDVKETLRQYHVTAEVIIHLVGEMPEASQPKKKRADKYDELIDWCKENHLLQVTPEDIAEQGDFSYATALKFIKDRPDLCRKVKNGLYELLDPETVKREESI